MISASSERTTLPPIQVLAIGEMDRDEFAPARAVLAAQTELAQADSVAQALSMLRGTTAAAQLLVLAQSWPGQFTHSEVDRLRAAAPLSRVWELAGCLCEGQLRSGRPWPAVLRCYSHQAAARFAQQFARLEQALPVAWDFPVTASDEERLISTAEEVPHQGSGLIIIVADDRDWSAALADAAAQRGYARLVVRPHVLAAAVGTAESPASTWIAGAAAVLWDATDAALHDADAIDCLRVAFGKAPILATVGFPRPESIRAGLAGGIASVLAKPLDIEDFFFQIAQAKA